VQLGLVCWCLARQHKSQFEQLIEAARKNHTGLKKSAVQSAVDVRNEERKLDDLIADNELLTTDDNQPAVNSQPLTSNLISVLDSVVEYRLSVADWGSGVCPMTWCMTPWVQLFISVGS